MRLRFFMSRRPSVRLDPSSNAPSQAGGKGPAMLGLDFIKIKQACGVKKNREKNVTRRRFDIIEKM